MLGSNRAESLFRFPSFRNAQWSNQIHDFKIIIIIIIISLKKNLETIPVNYSIDSLQKTPILGTSHIIRKVLQSEAWSLSGGDHRWFKRSTRKNCLWQETYISYNIIIIIIIIFYSKAPRPQTFRPSPPLLPSFSCDFIFSLYLLTEYVKWVQF